MCVFGYTLAMKKPLCPCSELEWKPEHLTLEHHPNCSAQPEDFVNNLQFIGKYSYGSSRYAELKEAFYSQSVVQIGDDEDNIKMLCKIKKIEESFTSQGIDMRTDWELVEILSPPELRAEWLNSVSAQSPEN